MGNGPTKADLVRRWVSPEGLACRDRLDAFLAPLVRASPADPARARRRAELVALLRGLPLARTAGTEVDLRGVDLSHARAPSLRLCALDLDGARLDHASLPGHVLDCTARGASFAAVDGRHVAFHGCDLAGASFVAARLSRARFHDTLLDSADLRDADLRDAHLAGVSLRQARIDRARLEKAQLAGADLRGASLAEAHALDASLGGANFDEHTVVTGASFGMYGLEAERTEWVLARGAFVETSRSGPRLRELDAIRRVLETRNEGGRWNDVLGALPGLREALAADPDFEWVRALALVPSRHRALLSAAKAAMKRPDAE